MSRSANYQRDVGLIPNAWRGTFQYPAGGIPSGTFQYSAGELSIEELQREIPPASLKEAQRILSEMETEFGTRVPTDENASMALPTSDTLSQAVLEG